MKNVSKKLLKVIEDLGGKVQKTGYNSFSKYHYVTESDINEAVLPALIKQGLLLTTSVESVVETPSTSDQKNRFASIVLVHKIIDTDSGEVLEFKSVGTGADTLDKAVYKAYTGACKYFLMKTLMLSGDDDPENDGVAKPAQASQGLSKPSFGSKPVAAPAPEKKGFMAKKTEQAVETKKPSFMAKKTVNAEPEVEDDEEDAAF